MTRLNEKIIDFKGLNMYHLPGGIGLESIVNVYHGGNTY